MGMTEMQIRVKKSSWTLNSTMLSSIVEVVALGTDIGLEAAFVKA